MKYILLTLALFIIYDIGFSQQDFNLAYEPIKTKAPLPVQYFSNSSERIKLLVKNQDIIDTQSARILYSDANGLLKKFFLNGYVLYDSPLSQYIQEVAEKTFASNPATLAGVSFYVTTFSEANAISFPDGTILINIGLINVLDNEAQLSFILAHEVGHFIKKHALRSYKQWETLKSQKGDTENEKISLLSFFHSREHEGEADAYGLNITSQSTFDANQAISALSNLEKEDTVLAPIRKNLIQLLSSDYYKLDSSLVKGGQKFRPTSIGNNDNKHSIFRGDPDKISSHPATDKREIAVEEILKSVEYSALGKNLNDNTARFEEMKLIALFETAQHSFLEKEYFLSLTISSELETRFPNNEFVQVLILKSLYWLAYYKDINGLNHLESDLPIYNRGRYWLIGKIMGKEDSADMKKMAYGYAKKIQKLMEKNDEFNFYIALSVEQYLGKQAANIFYMQYQNKFPAGKYIVLVNEKNQQP